MTLSLKLTAVCAGSLLCCGVAAAAASGPKLSTPSSARVGQKVTAQRRTAAAALASDGVYGRVLDEPETQALLSLLDVALSARVPVSTTASGSAHGARLTLRPVPGSTTVRTVRGRLHLAGLAVEVTG